jgi:hypothetical protein
VDPAGSHHLIQNCAISCGDDNIVMKPGSTFCSDITVADCAFGEGHGMSVGGQTNRGLDGMVVKNCSFDGTTAALRLKADPTQGGDVKNITYTNLTMQHVLYPIVFYSYYKNVGNPASISGNNLTTPDKVHAWNAEPPQVLASKTMPTWKNIAVTNLFSSDTRGYSIIWGLPREGFFVENMKLTHVRIAGGPGFEIYDAAKFQFAGESDVGKVIAANALAIIRQPRTHSVVAGDTAKFSVTVAGPETSAPSEVSYAWTFNGEPISDGSREDGAIVGGARSSTLTVTKVNAKSAGTYAVVVSAALDGYDPAKPALLPHSVPISIKSNTATLTVK